MTNIYYLSINTCFIAISVSASGCNEITQDDQGIPLGTRVHHHLEMNAFFTENSLTPVGAYKETREIVDIRTDG